MPGSGAASADDRPPAETLDAAVAALRRGGLVVAATETLLGLLGDPFHPDALRRAVALKQRPADDPFPLILPGSAALDRLATEPGPLARRLVAAFWPGPLTLLLPARADLPAAVVAAGAVAVRAPGPSPAAEICRRFDGPLIATSANRRSEAPPASPADLPADLVASVDLVVPGGSPTGVPSTIVAVDGDEWRVVREGGIGGEEIRRVAGGG